MWREIEVTETVHCAGVKNKVSKMKAFKIAKDSVTS